MSVEEALGLTATVTPNPTPAPAPIAAPINPVIDLIQKLIARIDTLENKIAAASHAEPRARNEMQSALDAFEVFSKIVVNNTKAVRESIELGQEQGLKLGKAIAEKEFSEDDAITAEDEIAELKGLIHELKEKNAESAPIEKISKLVDVALEKINHGRK